MDTVSAVHTFALIDIAESVLIPADGPDRTDFFAGSFEMNDGTIRAGFGTHAAFLAFCRVDLHALFTLGNGTETAGIDACTSKAETAVIGYRIR